MRFPGKGMAGCFFTLTLVLAAAGVRCETPPAAEFGPDCRFRNVIVMVADGASQSAQTLARWYKEGALNLDGLTSGMVKTHMADSVITDSAAAATAFATGHKTSGGFLGVGPRPEKLLPGVQPTAAPFEPVASVLEGARLYGRAIGLVATSRVTHATPAGFASHIPDRNRENQIMEQMVYGDIDVVFGGGARHLIPAGSVFPTSFKADWPGARTDGEDLRQVLLRRGYRVVDNRGEMMALTRGKAWGLFAESHMAPDLDRDEVAPGEPSLAEMTEKAIQLLADDPQGFFLLVEGSQTDWAGHDNDPAYLASEFLAFDVAVGRALAFARRAGQTLVLVFPDHDTGGLSIGHDAGGYPPPYTDTRPEDLLAAVKGARMTIGGVMRLLYADNAASVPEIQQAFSDRWNLTLTPMEGVAILGLGKDVPAVASYISRKKTLLGWATHGHTGEDVPLWAYTPSGSRCRPYGTLDNTALAGLVARALGFALDQVTSHLFVEVGSVFPDYELDTSDAANPAIHVGAVTFQVDKDLLFHGGKVYEMEGIVVHAPEIEKVYIPRSAVSYIQKSGQEATALPVTPGGES